NTGPSSGFVESRASKAKPNAYYEKLKESRMLKDFEQMDQLNLIESSRDLYKKFSNRFRVPGFISASSLPQLGKIVGPTRPETLVRQGDTVFIRWAGSPLPREGERYGTLTPKIVTQSLLNPTDFTVIDALGPDEDLPKDTRLAGYFYETSGR